MLNVKTVSLSHPQGIGVNSAEDFIAYSARVSNPGNQANTETAPRLLAYLVRNEHWSPFEMVHLTMEIKTTRDIARQILRHRSFSFQEFSQRYAQVAEPFVIRECRLQHPTNRQDSLPTDDVQLANWWREQQLRLCDQAGLVYEEALVRGIAKEVARAILPEGNTPSTLYMAGNVRSWIHYVNLRTAHGTQLEHQDIAWACRRELLEAMPSLSEVI